MAREFAQSFYASAIWKQCRELYKQKKCYLCERCGGIATEVHHIIPLSPDNIDDPEVTLNEANLMCLCHQCHMNEHSDDDRRFFIDSTGHVVTKKKIKKYESEVK